MELVDIKINDNMELTQAATGDAALVQGTDAYLQALRIEALTQEGELFFDPDFGWGLKDFLHREDTELTRAEIEHRICSKLAKHEEIEKSSIRITFRREEDILILTVRFLLNGEEAGEEAHLSINMNRVEVSIDVG